MTDPSKQHLDDLLNSGDLDGLLRLIDDTCDQAQWEVLESLAQRARTATERGHQLWPAADHAEHRLAKQGPAEFAARAVLRDQQRFGIASLAEVAASENFWTELDSHLPAGSVRALVAHECIARGQDLSGVDLPGDPLGLTLTLASWEPATEGPTIKAYDIDDPAPSFGAFETVALPGSGTASSDSATEALRDLVRTWTDHSNGTSKAVAVAGTAAEALAALDLDQVQLSWLTAAQAWRAMSWAAASGGAHGRRPGCARGRFDTWWCAAALTGLNEDEDPWPPEPEELGTALEELRWGTWKTAQQTAGWQLNLVIEDPSHGLAWALAAHDLRD